ncbi:Signal transduction protein [Candidatus Terasakiella magnetica]|nr:Signal transduction protein [Candidatus Terasakiella magnetica]
MNDIAALAKIDSFPYRHRLHEVMSTPVLTAPASLTLTEAVHRMYEARVSSIVGVSADGRADGIFTERDLLRILSTDGTGGLDATLAETMTRPVATVPAHAFVYVALGRMTRMGLRHLVVVDDDNRPLGMITGRALLKVRATEALVLGDSVEGARNGDDMKPIMENLPRLAKGLLSEGVTARNIASVVALVLRDLTARAAELAEQSLQDDGWGPAPARYAVIVLGSGGRGESLLAFDQDNAIVHDGKPTDDPWFAELGKRMNDTLHTAGIPLCKGLVMAREATWRKSLEEWSDEVHRWVFSLENQTVMNCDIFFDFQPVWGDRALAEQLRTIAIEKASQSAFFLRYLAQNVAGMDGSIGLFGNFVTKQGRLDIKKFGLLPLVSAARMRAIRGHVMATSTDERFTALKDAGALHEDDLKDFIEVREILLRIMLEQQLADLAMGISPSSRIDPKRFDKRLRTRLRWALKRLKTLKFICGVGG